MMVDAHNDVRKLDVCHVLAAKVGLWGRASRKADGSWTGGIISFG